MTPRLKHPKASPAAYKAMLALEEAVNKIGLEQSLLDLVRTRASQINNCTFCLYLHTEEARSHGESQRRLDVLSAWRDSPIFSDRERAALAWTEAVTLIAQNGVPDDVYEESRLHFSEEEIVNLTLAVNTINGWNRLNVAFRTIPLVETTARRPCATAYSASPGRSGRRSGSPPEKRSTGALNRARSSMNRRASSVVISPGSAVRVARA